MEDVLILAVARQPGGLTIAGMTTERDPTTGLRWVRPAPPGAPLRLEALRYADGSLVRPGDVVRLPLGEAQPEPPHVENVVVEPGDAPLERVRILSPERRAAFFGAHLDPVPRDVLGMRTRSLCLVRPEDLIAVMMDDEETGRFDVRLAFAVDTGRRREDGTPIMLRSNEEGIAVTDIYWRALMRSWMGDEPFMEVHDAELRERLGEIYVVVGLGRKGGPLVLGVHTVPEYAVTIDEDAL